MRVASTLLTLGSTSLRNGHCLLCRLRGAAAGAEVQVRTARWTQSLAVGTAQNERGSFEEPLFAQSGTKIDFESTAPAAQWKNVGIFIALFYCFGVAKDEDGFASHICIDLHQATAALPHRGTSKLAMEVVSPSPSR